MYTFYEESYKRKNYLTIFAHVNKLSFAENLLFLIDL